MKRGQTAPWRVIFEWENGIKGAMACHTQEDAERQAEVIRQNGENRGMAVTVRVSLRESSTNLR